MKFLSSINRNHNHKFAPKTGDYRYYRLELKTGNVTETVINFSF